jgi:hypothetical protein
VAETWKANLFRWFSLTRTRWLLVESLQWNDELEEYNHAQVVGEFAC